MAGARRTPPTEMVTISQLAFFSCAMPNSRTADVAAVRDRLGAVGGVDHQLHATVFHRVDDMRTAFQHLVDLLGGHAAFDEKALRAGGGDDLEAERGELLDRVENP